MSRCIPLAAHGAPRTSASWQWHGVEPFLSPGERKQREPACRRTDARFPDRGKTNGHPGLGSSVPIRMMKRADGAGWSVSDFRLLLVGAAGRPPAQAAVIGQRQPGPLFALTVSSMNLRRGLSRRGARCSDFSTVGAGAPWREPDGTGRANQSATGSDAETARLAVLRTSSRIGARRRSSGPPEVPIASKLARSCWGQGRSEVPWIPMPTGRVRFAMTRRKVRNPKVGERR